MTLYASAAFGVVNDYRGGSIVGRTSRPQAHYYRQPIDWVTSEPALGDLALLRAVRALLRPLNGGGTSPAAGDSGYCINHCCIERADVAVLSRMPPTDRPAAANK